MSCEKTQLMYFKEASHRMCGGGAVTHSGNVFTSLRLRLFPHEVQHFRGDSLSRALMINNDYLESTNRPCGLYSLLRWKPENSSCLLNSQGHVLFLWIKRKTACRSGERSFLFYCIICIIKVTRNRFICVITNIVICRLREAGEVCRPPHFGN